MLSNHKYARCWLKLHVLTQKSSDNALGGLGPNRGCTKTLPGFDPSIFRQTPWTRLLIFLDVKFSAT